MNSIISWQLFAAPDDEYAAVIIWLSFAEQLAASDVFFKLTSKQSGKTNKQSWEARRCPTEFPW